MLKLTVLSIRPLRTPARLLTMLPLLIPFSLPAYAGDTCAVKLNVVSSSGRPITSTWIELLDSSGKVELRKIMMGPDLEVCDFGFGRHSLRIGTNECFPLTIENLRVDLEHPIILRVQMQDCAGGYDGGNACLAYIRVRDDSGSALPGVAVSDAISNPPLQTDGYGRLQLWFVGSRNLRFTKQGYDDATVSIDCKRAEIDRELIMQSTVR